VSSAIGLSSFGSRWRACGEQGRGRCGPAGSARSHTARRGRRTGGVGMIFATSDGVVVKLGGPGTSVAGADGEVADGVARLLAGGPAEADGLDLAGLAGGGRHPGQAHQRLRVGEASAAVADLGEQPGGADGPGAGQTCALAVLSSPVAPAAACRERPCPSAALLSAARAPEAVGVRSDRVNLPTLGEPARAVLRCGEPGWPSFLNGVFSG